MQIITTIAPIDQTNYIWQYTRITFRMGMGKAVASGAPSSKKSNSNFWVLHRETAASMSAPSMVDAVAGISLWTRISPSEHCSTKLGRVWLRSRSSCGVSASHGLELVGFVATAAPPRCGLPILDPVLCSIISRCPPRFCRTCLWRVRGFQMACSCLRDQTTARE